MIKKLMVGEKVFFSFNRFRDSSHSISKFWVSQMLMIAGIIDL
jgi:hypothetical protein